MRQHDLRDVGIAPVGTIDRPAQHRVNHLGQLQGALIALDVESPLFTEMSVAMVPAMLLGIEFFGETVAAERDSDRDANRLLLDHELDRERHLCEMGKGVDLSLECLVGEIAHCLEACCCSCCASILTEGSDPCVNRTRAVRDSVRSTLAALEAATTTPPLWRYSVGFCPGSNNRLRAVFYFIASSAV